MRCRCCNDNLSDRRTTAFCNICFHALRTRSDQTIECSRHRKKVETKT